MRNLFTLFALLAIFSFAGCENSNKEYEEGEIEAPQESMSIAVFIQDSELNDEYYDIWTRLVIRGQDWCMIEIVDESMINDPIFLFGDAKTRNAVLCTTDGDYTYLIAYNPCQSPELPTLCTVLHCDDDNIFVEPCSINWITNEMSRVGDMLTLPIVKDKLTAQGITRTDRYNESIRKTFYDLFTKLQLSSEEHEEIAKDLLSDGKYENVKYVYKIWAKVGAPIAISGLYNDDEEVLKQMLEEEMDSYVESQIKELVLSDWWFKMKKWAKRAFWLLSYGEDENIDNYEDDYDEEKHEHFLGGKLGDDALERFMRITSNVSSKLRQLKNPDKSIPNTNGYKVSAQVEVVGVDDNNAYIRGRYTCENEQMTFIEQVGFVYHCKYGEKTEVVVDNFDSTLPLLDLYWNTQYYVYAFVIANGKRYESKTIPFITEPYYGVTPSDLFFDSEGGSIGVAVSLSSKGEYRIIDYPEWCVICEGEEVFFVDVSPCESDRSGVITVEFLGLNGMRYVEEVSVRQKNMYGWNNTEWELEGLETYTDKDGKTSQRKLFLTVKMAPNSFTTSNSDIYISLPFTFHNKEYAFGDNGDLIVEMNHKQSDGYSEVTSESTLVLRRKDHSNISWSLTMFEHMEYFYSDSYSHYDIEAEGTGTLVVE